MRKKILLLVTCAAFICMTGCSSDQPVKAPTAGTSSGTEAAPAGTEAPAATETPAPEETTLSLGKKSTLGNWDIKVKKASVKQKIKNGKYYYFKPSKKDNTFVIVDMSVENKGTKEEAFLPRVGMKDKAVFATLYYKDEYEYSPTELMGYDKDLATEGIKPLTKENGILVFEVPKKAAKSKKQLKLTFKLDEEGVSYALK